jgi:hypothetical protein
METRPTRSPIQAAFIAAGVLAAVILICGVPMACSGAQDDRPTMMYFSAKL